jgi:hypothetical protein
LRPLALCILLALGCAHGLGGATRPADSAQAEAEVTRALDELHDAAAHADEERYFAHFAPDGIFLGTDATERWDARAFRAYAHPYFAKGKAWSFRGVRRHLRFEGDLCWFDEELETQNLGPARGSGVLRHLGGGWKIEQYVLSITVPNDRFKAVKQLLEEKR